MAVSSLKQAFETTGFEKAPPLQRISPLPRFQYLPNFVSLRDVPQILKELYVGITSKEFTGIVPTDIQYEKRDSDEVILLNRFSAKFPNYLSELITACEGMADTYPKAYTEMSTLIGHALKFCVQIRMCTAGASPEIAFKPIAQFNKIASQPPYEKNDTPLISEIKRAIDPESTYLSARINSTTTISTLPNRRQYQAPL